MKSFGTSSDLSTVPQLLEDTSRTVQQRSPSPEDLATKLLLSREALAQHKLLPQLYPIRLTQQPQLRIVQPLACALLLLPAVVLACGERGGSGVCRF